MSTNLERAIVLIEQFKKVCVATTVNFELLETAIAEMKSHEAEHGWINQRLNMLVEIYNIVGADGSQCVGRVKDLVNSNKTFLRVIEKLREDNGGTVPNWLLDI